MGKREPMRNILFVCSAGVDRSPAAAMWARHMVAQEGIEMKADSFGLYRSITRDLRHSGIFDRYDRIFIMESCMEKDVREWYSYKGDVVCLSVEERDEWSDRELNEVFQRKFAHEIVRKKMLYE